MKALLVIAGMAVATALVSGALLVGRGVGAAPAPPAPAPAGPAVPGNPGEDRAALAALERRLRVLEARIEELGVRSDPVPPLPGAPGGAAAAEAAVPPETDDGTDSRGGDGAPRTEVLETLEERVRALAASSSSVKESRRDAEIRRRIDRAVLAMGLTADERARVEEIAREHVGRSDAIVLRAKEALKNSPFGFSEADRALVEQLSLDRARLDRETEQSLVLLVGADRWKAGLKLEKEQEAKEKAVKRLEKPW